MFIVFLLDFRRNQVNVGPRHVDNLHLATNQLLVLEHRLADLLVSPLLRQVRP